MSSRVRQSVWLRSSILVASLLTSLVSVAVPVFSQDAASDTPQPSAALRVVPRDTVVPINPLDIGASDTDLSKCDQKTLIKAMQTKNATEGLVGTRSPVKSKISLCGNGEAINNQIIIQGPPQALADLIKLIPNISIKRVLMQPIAVNSDVNTKTISNPNTQTILYTIDDEMPVPELVKKVNFGIRIDNKMDVTATPNYLIASKSSDVFSAGHSVGGSPSEPKGITRTVQDFEGQWAWKVINKPVSATGPFSGKSVIIGIFDAFCTPNAPLRGAGTLDTTPRLVNISSVAERDHENKPIQDVCVHGEYVWSLSHAIAPDATYRFYPVLDNFGLGDIGTLVLALQKFATDVNSLEERKGRTDLHGVVINLSLNIWSASPDNTQPVKDILDRLIAMGATVVAAAGNDSRAGIQPMRLPAGYPGVIGVSALQITRQRASYSNWVPAGNKDVSAPGGDGDCSKLKDSYYCVVGMYHACINWIKTAVPGILYCKGYAPRYMAWAGTSFATPMVSGLAALVIEKNGFNVEPRVVQADLAAHAIPLSPQPPSADDGVGDGVIDVDNTAQ